MVDYSYLNHIETEFLADEQEYGLEADKILSDFFKQRKGAQARAFMDESL